VNAAARLEAIAEPDQILISHQTWALVKDRMRSEPVGEVRVKGIAHPLLTYEIVEAYVEGTDEHPLASNEA
jgi:adenylate cyclase